MLVRAGLNMRQCQSERNSNPKELFASKTLTGIVVPSIHQQSREKLWEKQKPRQIQTARSLSPRCRWAHPDKVDKMGDQTRRCKATMQSFHELVGNPFKPLPAWRKGRAQASWAKEAKKGHKDPAHFQEIRAPYNAGKPARENSNAGESMANQPAGSSKSVQFPSKLILTEVWCSLPNLEFCFSSNTPTPSLFAWTASHLQCPTPLSSDILVQGPRNRMRHGSLMPWIQKNGLAHVNTSLSKIQ